MASEDSRLLKLPLELRNAIYDFTGARPTGPQLILKEWFEKVDTTIERLPPRSATNAASTAIVAIDDDEESEDEADEDENGSESGEAGASEQGVGEVGMDVSIDIQPIGDAPVVVHADVVLQHDPHDAVDAEMSDPVDGDAVAAGSMVGQHDESESEAEDGQEEDEEENESDEENAGEGEVEDEEEDEEEEESDGEVDGVIGKAQGSTTARPPPPVQGRTTKYRHMLPILQLSDCPPPKELLQLCKQVHSEAVQQFRDRCILTIDVNKGFQHFSFFNETMTKLMQEPHSPLKHIRKLRLIITWDSEWLREKCTPPDREIVEGQEYFFGYYFGERMQVIRNLVEASPALQKVTIEYHDTEDTTESRAFMADRLAALQMELMDKLWMNANDFPMPVDTEFKEHFSQAGTAHARDSILALRRAEMDRFLQTGLDMR